MRLGMVVAGALIGLGAWSSMACGGDELLKWQCDRCTDACAANATDAKSASDCSNSTSTNEFVSCEPTGDACVCPEGGDKCAITPVP